METNKYQELAMTTCMESSNNFAYMFMNLIGEVGELTEKVNAKVQDKDLGDFARNCLTFSVIAKVIRKDPDAKVAQMWKSIFEGIDTLTDEEREEIKKEVGDCCWQIAGLCRVMGWSLDDVMQANLDKLSSRQKRGVIDGNGDNR